MEALETLRASLPEAAKDLKLNLKAVLDGGALTKEQRWGCALASAIAGRHAGLEAAVLEAARGAGVPAEVLEDARGAAAVMAMNNVYYRFRHMIGKPSYSEKRPGLRMNRLGAPLGSKLDMELFALAVSAINGCEMCVRAHEKVVVDGGLSDEQVHDAVRIAAVVAGVSAALPR